MRANYAPNGDRDPHRWFGFLSSPEIADVVGKSWLGAGSCAVAPP